MKDCTNLLWFALDTIPWPDRAALLFSLGELLRTLPRLLLFFLPERRDDVLPPRLDRAHDLLVRDVVDLHHGQQLLGPSLLVLLNFLNAGLGISDDDQIVIQPGSLLRHEAAVDRQRMPGHKGRRI